MSIPRDPWINNTKLLNVSIEQARRCTQDMGGFDALVDHVVINTTPWQQGNQLEDLSVLYYKEWA